MKIWFDLSNSPHVNMFHDMISELESIGHTVIITCRPLANTIELLEQKKLRFTVIGKHYGKNIFKKVIGFPVRVWQLYSFLRSLRPDVAVSQSSFHSPLVARLLGIPSIYTNDNEHAMGNKGSFLFATKVFIPENFSFEQAVKIGASASSLIQYPGVKEGIYLWKKGEAIHTERNKSYQKEIKIFIRPEPQTAQYYKGKHNFMDEILLELQDVYSITILCRNANQHSHYSGAKFAKLHVPKDPLDFDHIAKECTLFIGAGGSMTRELAILGIPTISVYQDDLLEVDKLLIRKKLMSHMPHLKMADVVTYIATLNHKQPDLELMQKGKEAYLLFRNEILKFEETNRIASDNSPIAHKEKVKQFKPSNVNAGNQSLNN